jgi:hypothetical protein
MSVREERDSFALAHTAAFLLSPFHHEELPIIARYCLGDFHFSESFAF